MDIRFRVHWSAKNWRAWQLLLYICKTVIGTGQTGGKGQDKNMNLCLSTFVSCTSYLEYKNSYFVHQKLYKTKNYSIS